MSEARGRIKGALEDKLTDKQLSTLLDEVLSITKHARGWCPNCKKAVNVEVADSKAVVSAISELLTQAEGRPKQETDASESGVRVVYQVIVGGDADDGDPADVPP